MLFNSLAYRWISLIFICFFAFGGYLNYDTVGVVQTQLSESLHLTESEFSTLYSAYTLPSCIVPVFAGYLFDRHGNRVGLLMTLLISLLGTLVVALAGELQNFALMIVGRALFSIGAEACFVAQNNITLDYFCDDLANTYLSVALAISISFSRLGSLTTFALTGWIVENVGGDESYTSALWFGCAASVLSLLSGIVFVALDRRAEAALGAPIRQATLEDTHENDELIAHSNDSEDNDKGNNDTDSNSSVSRRAARPRWRARLFQKWRLFLRIVATLDWSFLYLLGITTLYYGVVRPLQSTATAVLTEKGIAHVNWITSMVPLLSLLLSPPLGVYVDRRGNMMILCTVGFLLLTVSAILLLATGHSAVVAWLAFLTLGVAFSVEPAAVWPCIPVLCPPQHTGFAFGAMTVAINLSLTVAYTIFGLMPNSTNFFAALALSFTGMTVCLAWIRRERRFFEGRCDQPPHEVAMK